MRAFAYLASIASIVAAYQFDLQGSLPRHFMSLLITIKVQVQVLRGRQMLRYADPNFYRNFDSCFVGMLTFLGFGHDPDPNK